MWSSLVEQIKIEGVYCYKAGIYYQEVSLIGFLGSCGTWRFTLISSFRPKKLIFFLFQVDFIQTGLHKWVPCVFFVTLEPSSLQRELQGGMF